MAVWTVGAVLSWSTDYFERHGIDTPRIDAEVILMHVLNKDRIHIYTEFDKPLQQDELSRLHDAVKRRAEREPVAYITGHREFMGMPFAVTHDVLIPRPDTEILVEKAVARLNKMESPVFLDIGTGSGAIALAVLHFVPSAKAVLVDVSSAALRIAAENAAALGLSERAEFIESDLFAGLDDRVFDAILSNPPYIPDGDIAGLAPEVRDYEPHMALAGGADGLDFYRRIIDETPGHLESDGFMSFEAGIDEAEPIAELLRAKGFEVSTARDLAGIERVVTGVKVH